MDALGRGQGAQRRRAGATSYEEQPQEARRTQGAMSEVPEGTVANAVGEEVLEECSGGDNKERVEEEVTDLGTCRLKPNGRSWVWKQCPFLFEQQTHAVCATCSVVVPCPTGNISSRQE